MSNSSKRSYDSLEDTSDLPPDSSKRSLTSSQGSNFENSHINNFPVNNNKHINIPSFKKALEAISGYEKSFQVDQTDISHLIVSELKYKSSDHIISEAISHVMRNVDFDSASPDPELLSQLVPQFSELEEKKYNSNLQSVRHLNELQNSSLKPRPREVNYVPTFTPEKPFTKSAENEILISVSIYHPKKHVKTQTFSMLGSHCLKRLRDCFYCLSDVEFNSKSSFFFIENIFYVYPKDSNQAALIIDWMGKESQYWSQHKCGQKEMETTQLGELIVQIGKKYLFCHSGDCEHIITFDEIREINVNDKLNYNEYPIQTFQNKTRRRKCRICKTFSACYITYNDKSAPEVPCHFCEDCYKPLHLDKDGNKLEDHEVYRYHHE